MVQSINGKITNGDNPHIHKWTSKEDQVHFAKLIENASLILMGRKTYEAAKPTIKHATDTLRVVLTSTPEKYNEEAIPNQLEFTNDDPVTLVKKLADRGFTSALLVGGGNINSLFFKAGLVNELLLTIEPKLFGKGNELVSEAEFDANLKLKHVEKLNSLGTLLLKYTIQ